MNISRTDVEQTAKAGFPHMELSSVLAILDEYGCEPHEQEKVRVQMAILKLSKGSQELLLHNVVVAKKDFRDVLMWAADDEQTPEPRQSMMRRIWKILGRK